MNPVKVAVIGAGQWGRNHVRTLQALPGAELVAICDSDQQRRAAFQAQYPAAIVTDKLDEAVRAAEAVVVATPAASHAAIAGRVVREGKPVLVEKPFALSVRDAEGLVELAESGNVQVLTGHLLIYHTAVEHLRRMIEAGDLGDVYYLYSQRVNLGQVRPDENALWSFGPHDISVAMELLQQTPVRVAAQGRCFLQAAIEDVVFLTMEFETGVLAHAQMSWLDPHKERTLTVVGSDKMVVFDDMQPREKLKIYDKGVTRPPDYASFGESLSIREGDIWIPRLGNAEPLAAELRHFLAVVRGTEAPRSDARSGLNVVRVLEAATRSLENGGGAVAVNGEDSKSES